MSITLPRFTMATKTLLGGPSEHCGVRCDPTSSLPPLVSMAAGTSTNEWSQINWTKLQSFKTISDWFTTWQPHQQQTVLCSITNMCSTAQLEALATTLEPVFHQDYRLSTIEQLPMAITATQKQGGKHGVKPPKSVTTRSKITPSTKPQSSTIGGPTRGSSNQTEAGLLERHAAGDTTSGVDRRAASIPEFASGLADVIVRHATGAVVAQTRARNLAPLKAYAAEMCDDVMSGVWDAVHMKRAADNNRRIVDRHEELQSMTDVTDALGNFITDRRPPTGGRYRAPRAGAAGAAAGRPTVANPDGKEAPAESVMTSSAGIAVNGSHERDSGCELSDTGSHVTRDHVRGEEREMDEPWGVFSSDHLAAVIKASLLRNTKSKTLRHRAARSRTSFDLLTSDRNTETRLASRHHNAWSAHPAPGGSAPPSAPPEMSACVTLPAGDVSDRDRHNHKTCFGTANAPETVVAREVTSGRLWNPENSFSRGAEKSMNSRKKPWAQGSKLPFHKQIKQIWQWISVWDESDKLSLLVELVKVCSVDLVNYLTQCLFQRLKDRVDVNWLPDHLLLLILSYLPVSDLESCAQVCQRWKFLCSVDDLWMVKCHEFGFAEDVPDLVERLVAHHPAGTRIDWKLAYLEIQRITRDAKATLVKPFSFSTVGSPDIRSNQEQASDKGSDSLSMAASQTTEVPLRRGTAAQLARESDLLKWGPSLQRGHHPGVMTSQPPALRRSLSTLTPLPAIKSKFRAEARKSWPTAVNTGSDLSPQGDRSVQDGVTFTGALSTYGPSKAGAQSAPPTDASLGLDSAAVGVSTRSGSKTRTPSRPSRNHRHRHPTGEVALDVRPDLKQAPDILGKSEACVRLQWKNHGNEGSKVKDARSTGQFAGTVPSVQKVRKFQGHLDSVLCVEFDRRRLISGSLDRSVRIWDIRSGRSIHKLYGHKGAVTCLKFDNETLYTGSWDTQIMVWDLVTFKRKAVLTGHSGSVSCLHLGDQYLLSGSHDSTVRVWGKNSGLCLKVIQGHKSQVMAMACSGDVLVTGSSDSTIRVTNIRTEECLVTMTTSEPIYRLVMSGSLVITASRSGRVDFHNLDTGQGEAAIQAHTAPINALAFHRGRFFTASGDHTIKEWDLVTMTHVRSLQGHKGSINDFKVSDQRMVSCCTDGHIRVWDLRVALDKLTFVSEDQIPSEVVNQRDVNRDLPDVVDKSQSL